MMHYLELLSLPTSVSQLLPPTANEEETQVLHRVSLKKRYSVYTICN